MRAFFSAPVSLVLAIACAHCGSAYVGSSTAIGSPAGTSGGASSTTATTAAGTPGPGTTGSGTSTTGGTSAPSTTGASTAPTLSLSVDGQTSRQFGGVAAFAQLLTDANVKVGDVTRADVGNDGTFTISMDKVLESGTSYTLAIYIGSAQSNGCNLRDEQWLLTVPASTNDVVLSTGRSGANQSVCGEF